MAAKIIFIGISWFVLSVMTCMNMEKKQESWKTSHREPKRTIVVKKHGMKRVEHCYNIKKMYKDERKRAGK